MSIWRVLVGTADDAFRCPSCEYMSYPSARYSPWTRAALGFLVSFVLPLLLLFGVLGLAGVLISAFVAISGYFALVIYQYVHSGPPD